MCNSPYQYNKMLEDDADFHKFLKNRKEKAAETTRAIPGSEQIPRILKETKKIRAQKEEKI